MYHFLRTNEDFRGRVADHFLPPKTANTMVQDTTELEWPEGVGAKEAKRRRTDDN